MGGGGLKGLISLLGVSGGSTLPCGGLALLELMVRGRSYLIACAIIIYGGLYVQDMSENLRHIPYLFGFEMENEKKIRNQKRN